MDVISAATLLFLFCGRYLLVPLAVPLVAGPSTMAVVILLATKDPSRVPSGCWRCWPPGS